MLKGYLGRQALSLRRGILSLNQDRHLCQGATGSGQGLSILGARVAPYNARVLLELILNLCNTFEDLHICTQYVNQVSEFPFQ